MRSHGDRVDQCEVPVEVLEGPGGRDRPEDVAGPAVVTDEEVRPAVVVPVPRLDVIALGVPPQVGPGTDIPDPWRRSGSYRG